MLQLEDVHVYYGASHVVHGVSLSVGQHSCVAVVGRNGVGKTTLMRSIMGLTPAARGAVRYRNQEITHWPPEQIMRQGIALVPQGRRVFRSLTVRENLAVAHVPRGSWTVERVYELFPRLAERSRHRASQLSGGEQQMLAIGRALVTNPSLIVMDEPSEGLAPILVQEVGRTIQRLKETGLSILLVEQNLALACSVAETMYVMSTGAMVWEGTPQALMADAELKANYLGV